MPSKKIGIIGCGNMGEALLNCLSKDKALSLSKGEKRASIMAGEFDAGRRDYIRSKYKIVVESDNKKIVEFADVIILAVKPKDFEALLKNEICLGALKNKLLISIAAGITTKYIEDIIGRDIPVIRVMPNMAAVIGESISSISSGRFVTPDNMKLAREIFMAIGDVVEVDEKFTDSVTAVSGSGPAYFFYMAEALIEAGCAMGLKEDVVRKLVLKTALGSAKLLEILKEDPAIVRAKVTSKGGTTEAAIKVFESKKFKNIIKDAVKAALARSKELSAGD